MADDELEPMLAGLQAGEFIYEQPAIPDVEYSFKSKLGFLGMMLPLPSGGMSIPATAPMLITVSRSLETARWDDRKYRDHEAAEESYDRTYGDAAEEGDGDSDTHHKNRAFRMIKTEAPLVAGRPIVVALLILTTFIKVLSKHRAAPNRAIR